METVFRGLNVDVHPPGKITYGNEYRVHTLIRNKDDGRSFVDVVPFSFGPYIVPFRYEMLAWVLVPDKQEIPRNYDLEEFGLGSILTRYNVAITQEEFDHLLSSIEQPQANETTESA